MKENMRRHMMQNAKSSKVTMDLAGATLYGYATKPSKAVASKVINRFMKHMTEAHELELDDLRSELVAWREKKETTGSPAAQGTAVAARQNFTFQQQTLVAQPAVLALVVVAEEGAERPPPARHRALA